MDHPEALLRAASFAARAHHGQIRKDGRTPYVAHVFRVCLIVRHVFGLDDQRLLIAALLHDTIEDTTTDFDDIAETFGEEIARWVSFLTKNKKLPEERREAAYLAELAAAPWQVKACKLADLYDNMTDSVHLPVEKRPKSLLRYAQYWNAFRTWTEPELQGPLEKVRLLFDPPIPDVSS